MVERMWKIINKLIDQYERLLTENMNYRQAILSAQAVHWEWDHMDDKALILLIDGTVPNRNKKIYGKLSNCIHPDDVQHLRCKIDLCIIGTNRNFECEHRVRVGNGGYRWVITRGQVIVGRNESVKKIIGMSFDITVKHTEEIKLIELASRDSLTGLLNRASFVDKVREFLDATKNTKKKAVLLYLDLDDFKTVNDSWGHDVGDAYLIETAMRLTSCVRGRDSIARLGGDEFAILIDDIEQLDEIKNILVRIQNAFEKPFDILGHEDAIAVSIGAAVLPDDGKTVETLMKCADVEMYRSKRLRKNNFNYYYEQINNKQLSESANELR